MSTETTAAKVSLVWATPDGDGLIGYMARVSNPANQDNPDVAGLIRYMLRNHHWSPFEMASMCVEIETTRDIGRQLLRHRSFSFQEFSQRYASVETLLAEPTTRECRLQDEKNRQNSLATDDKGLQQWWEQQQVRLLNETRSVYVGALERGIAKEQARAVLMEGLTPTRMYMAGTLRSWIHYTSLREDAATQKEHREVAVACKGLIEKTFPTVASAVWPAVGGSLHGEV